MRLFACLVLQLLQMLVQVLVQEVDDAVLVIFQQPIHQHDGHPVDQDPIETGQTVQVRLRQVWKLLLDLVFPNLDQAILDQLIAKAALDEQAGKQAPVVAGKIQVGQV